MLPNTDSLLSVVTSLVDPDKGLNTSGIDPIASMGISTGGYHYSEKLFSGVFRTWAGKKVAKYFPEKMALSGAKVNTTVLDAVDISRINNWIEERLRIYKDAQIAANIYGNAIIIRLVDDGKEDSDPISLENAKRLDFSGILMRSEFVPSSTAYGYTYGQEAEYYGVYTLAGASYSGIAQLVSQGHWHKSRVLRFNGDELDKESRRNTSGYDDSIYVKFLEPWIRYTSGLGYASTALHDFEQVSYGIQDFRLLSSEEPEKVMKYLALMRWLNSSMRWNTHDKEDDVTMLSRTFSGVPEVLEKVKEEMIAASGLTRPQLYQEHPSGLAATGQSERLAEANDIKARGQNQWGQMLKDDVEIFLAINGIDINPLDWSLEWQSLFEETPEEKSVKERNYSIVDRSNIAAGVYTPQEARSRYEGDMFNPVITLNQESGEEMTDEESSEPEDQEQSADIIEREGSQYVLWDKEHTRKLGTHSSYAKALKQERAIRASKHSRDAEAKVDTEKKTIEVNGEVLPLSEYFQIADEIPEED